MQTHPAIRLLISIIFLGTIGLHSTALGQKLTSTGLLGNSSNGAHSGTDMAEAIAEAVRDQILANPDYTEEQKQRLLKSIELSQDASEIANTIRDGKYAIDDNAQYWGDALLQGYFDTTEVSGCWTDSTALVATVELYMQNGMLVGRLNSDSKVLYHATGARCAGSDQGPAVTEAGSEKIRALGYFDKDENGLTIAFEATDTTHWTLASGGDVGVGSFMQFYLPHLYATDSAAGGFSGMFISQKQIEDYQHITLSGTIRGSGATTQGVVGILIHEGSNGKIPQSEFRAFSMAISEEFKSQFHPELSKKADN